MHVFTWIKGNCAQPTLRSVSFTCGVYSGWVALQTHTTVSGARCSHGPARIPQAAFSPQTPKDYRTYETDLATGAASSFPPSLSPFLSGNNCVDVCGVWIICCLFS